MRLAFQPELRQIAASIHLKRPRPMAFSLFNLFNADNRAADGLSQSEREAIADALYFCMYADNRLTCAESRVIEDWQGALSWDAAMPFVSYEERSIAAARRAKDDATCRRDLLASIGARLVSEKSRATLESLTKRLAQADGDVCDAESGVLAELRAAVKAGR